jgi:hypothetical protein
MTKDNEDKLAGEFGFHRNPEVSRVCYSAFIKPLDGGNQIRVWQGESAWVRARLETGGANKWHRRFGDLREAFAGEGGEKFGHSWRDENYENTVEPGEGVEI